MSFEDEESVKLVAPADFYGPTQQRHCTTLCGVMIFLMWAAMSVIGISACTNGDYRIVLYPLDYDGNICGTDYAANMTEYPYLLYVNSYTGGVCVRYRLRRKHDGISVFIVCQQLHWRCVC